MFMIVGLFFCKNLVQAHRRYALLYYFLFLYNIKNNKQVDSYCKM